MRATGIVRRIDDIGRVVIPTEIRKYLNIREGDPVEVQYNRNGEIILRPYRKSWEECALEWYESYEKLLSRCYFRFEGDYTFCIANHYNTNEPERAGFAKRFVKDEHNPRIAKVAAYANAMGYDLNEMIGYGG
jgi:transcriptional pleiotropic regulator of transition state genes